MRDEELAQRRLRPHLGHAPISLDGATVLVGEQVLSVDPAAPPEDLPDADGTYYSASMVPPGARSRSASTCAAARSAGCSAPTATSSTIGREGNDINFPDDPFISGHHAELRLATAACYRVTDLGSRNGTFVRVHDEQVLKHGDYVFLGQQLLRVEIV